MSILFSNMSPRSVHVAAPYVTSLFLFRALSTTPLHLLKGTCAVLMTPASQDFLPKETVPFHVSLLHGLASPCYYPPYVVSVSVGTAGISQLPWSMSPAANDVHASMFSISFGHLVMFFGEVCDKPFCSRWMFLIEL